MAEQRLADSEFIDIFAGKEFTDITGLTGASGYLAPAPTELLEEIKILKESAREKHQTTHRREFSLIHDGVIYRITVTDDMQGDAIFIIRKTKNSILPVSKLAIDSSVISLLEDTKTSGLFLVTGEMAVGKTTTATAFMSHRIASCCTTGVAVEDPTEARLEGLHGSGRCFQIEVTEFEGYSGALKRVYRMGVQNIFVGEIRDSETAYEVLKLSLNGSFILATIHGLSVSDAIDRFSTMCLEKNGRANAMIAKCLCGISWQRMQENRQNGILKKKTFNIAAYALGDSSKYASLRGKIASGSFNLLNEDFDSMSSRDINGY